MPIGHQWQMLYQHPTLENPLKSHEISKRHRKKEFVINQDAHHYSNVWRDYNIQWLSSSVNYNPCVMYNWCNNSNPNFHNWVLVHDVQGIRQHGHIIISIINYLSGELLHCFIGKKAEASSRRHKFELRRRAVPNKGLFECSILRISYEIESPEAKSL